MKGFAHIAYPLHEIKNICGKFRLYGKKKSFIHLKSDEDSSRVDIAGLREVFHSAYGFVHLCDRGVVGSDV